jgi:DNA-binding MarR family transcriptional regulator
MQEYLGLLIAVARRRISQAVVARVSAQQLTAKQFWLLVAIAENPGISQARLAERVRADAPAVSRTLATLLARRLVRAELDPADRRRTRVTLTPAGERMASQLAAVAREIRDAVVAGMSPGEIAAVRDGLRKVIANVERLEARSSRGVRG